MNQIRFQPGLRPRTPQRYLTTLPGLPSRVGRATPLVILLDAYDVHFSPALCLVLSSLPKLQTASSTPDVENLLDVISS